MTGLISSPVPAPEPANTAVAADGWFPSVNLSDVRDRLRLGEGAVTNARLTEAIEGGMLHAFRELADWRTAHVLAGIADLAGVTELKINNRNYAVVLWERIVRYFAGADLAADYRDVTATDQGLDRAAEKDLTSDELRRRALAAVADLLSLGGTPVPRNRVELI
ncbi:head completion/stabilization protein [Sphingobium sp.]|uniref:head completion/stabilization protein n=1 Tax=Sphingobium sp. TaxID=1912891 RepID=UPI0028BE8485|nr:head completion/stabilization protein [Sphingobium sp.]